MASEQHAQMRQRQSLCTHRLDPSIAVASQAEGICPTCRERLSVESSRCPCCTWRWTSEVARQVQDGFAHLSRRGAR